MVDCKISPDYLSLDLVDSLSVLEPYGENNPQPVFGVYGLKITGVTSLSEGKHVRLDLVKNNSRIRVVKFGTPFDEFPYKAGDTVNLAVKITKNFFKEKYYLSVQALDIHLSSADEEKYFKEKNDYEYFRLTNRGGKELYPSREVCKTVYRFIKTNKGFSYNTDELYFRLQESVNYSQLIFALAAFKEAQLIDIDGRINLLPATGKADLENTKVLRALREKLSIVRRD